MTMKGVLGFYDLLEYPKRLLVVFRSREDPGEKGIHLFVFWREGQGKKGNGNYVFFIQRVETSYFIPFGIGNAANRLAGDHFALNFR